MGSSWILPFGLAATLVFGAELFCLACRVRAARRALAEDLRSGRPLRIRADRRRGGRRATDSRL
jgi:hypothetical protein